MRNTERMIVELAGRGDPRSGVLVGLQRRAADHTQEIRRTLLTMILLGLVVALVVYAGWTW